MLFLLGAASVSVAQTSAATAEPVIVTAAPTRDFTAEALPLERRATQLIEAAPNARLNEAGADSFEDVYSVRGLTNTPNFSKQSLTIYIDDVPSSSTYANFPEQGELGAAALFRGPQGDYFGKNGEAGVLELRTVAADAARFGADVTGGNYELANGHALAVEPFAQGRAFLKLEGDYFTRDGFLRNTFRHTRPDFQQHAFGAISLRLVPANEWDITLSAQLHNIEDGVQRFVPLTAPDPLRVDFDFDGRTRIRGDIESLRIARTFDFGRLTLITSRRDWQLDPYEADFDYSPVPFVRGKIVLGQTQIAQEVRLDSAADETAWRWRAGLFVDRVGSDGSETFAFPQFAKVVSFDDELHEIAIFGRSTWQLGRGFDFTAGMRIEYSDESITRTRVVTLPPVAARFDTSRSEWNVQPRIALSYNWSPDLSLFVDSTYGYKAGGFSYLETDPQLAQFDTERVWLNEIGIRGAFPEQHIETRAALFVNRIEDYQVERPAIPPDITIFNAPLVVSWGGECEISARPVTGLTLRAALGYTRSEFRDFHDPFTGVSYHGNRTPFTPEFTANVSARYGWRGAFIQAEVLAAGETFYDEANSRDLREGPHAQLNTRVGYEHKRFSVALFCDNATDERYFTQKIASAGVGTPAAPRTFGAVLKFEL